MLEAVVYLAGFGHHDNAQRSEFIDHITCFGLNLHFQTDCTYLHAELRGFINTRVSSADCSDIWLAPSMISVTSLGKALKTATVG